MPANLELQHGRQPDERLLLVARGHRPAAARIAWA